MSGVVSLARRVTDHTGFQTFITGVIVLNAVLLGLETYGTIRGAVGPILEIVDDLILWIFVAEIVLRIVSYGGRPWRYFGSGWNIFDFLVVGAAFVPGVGANATALRMVRLLRVFRLITQVPELRMLVATLGKSVKPVTYLALLALIVTYVYAMVGWQMFHETDPEHWGTIGQAMLSLFIVLTLENWPNLLDAVSGSHQYAWVYFVSFVALATFVLLNILIGVVLTAMEEARREDLREQARADGIGVQEKLHTVRTELEELERLIEVVGVGQLPAPGDDRRG